MLEKCHPPNDTDPSDQNDPLLHINDHTNPPIGYCTTALENSFPSLPESDNTGYHQRFAADMAQRKTDEQALRENRDLLAKTQKIAHVGSWELDLLTDRLTWSDEVYRIFGLKVQEFKATYKAFLAHVHPDDREIVDSAYVNSLKEGKDGYEIQHRVIRKNTGEIRYVHEKCFHERDQSERVVRSVGVVQDITERIQAEKAIRKSEQRIPLLFENAPLGYQSLDKNGKFIEVNQVWLDTLGYNRNEVLGKWFGDFLAPELIPSFLEQFPRFKSAGTISTEFLMIHKNGERRLIAFNGSIAHWPNGSFKQTYCIIADITEKRKNEAALKRFRFSIDNLVDAVFWVSESGYFTDVNDGACRKLGYTREELLTMCVADIDPDFPQERWTSHWEEMKHYGIMFIETRHRTKSGKIIPMETVIHHQCFENTWYNCVTARDITLRKQMEDKLRKSELKYRALVENSQSLIYTIDADGTLRFVSPNVKVFMGYTPEEIIDNDFRHLVHEADIPLCETFLQKTTKTHTIRPGVEYRILHKDGSVRWQRSVLNPVFDEDRRITLFVGNAVDITDRKHSETALRDSEEKYRQLAENTDVILWEYDIVSDRWSYVAPQAERILGFAPEEWTDIQFWIDHIHPEDREWASKYCADCTARGVAHEFEYRFLTKHGEHRWIRDVVNIEKTDEAPIILRGCMFDIDDLKKAEAEREKLQAQLLQAQKMESVGRLAGGVAHDFNNMLSVIQGYSEIAMEKIPAKDALQDDLKEILDAARRSADITRQLLAFARKQTISPKVLDLNDIVGNMLKMIRRLIGENIDLSWQPGGNLWPVLMDPAQVDQILANLCINARDAIDGVGKLTIETGNVSIDSAYCGNHAGFIPGEFLMLAVSDDGHGMDEETKANIFEPFFTTKGFGEGTGLGLSTVYGIVKQNNGFVNVYSEKGQGTTFKIYLPKHASPANNGLWKKPAARIPRGRGETVLIVEDEISILKLAKKMLERLGYIILAANSPGDAIDLAAKHGGTIDLLITDVVMPEMSGRDLANQLQGACPDVKVLYMSGYTANVIAHQGVLDEGVNFMQKPFSIREMATMVRKAL